MLDILGDRSHEGVTESKRDMDFLQGGNLTIKPSPLPPPDAAPPIDKAPTRDRTEAVDLHRLIMQQLEEALAQEIVTIPLAAKSTIADHMVIASGRSARHVAAIAENLAHHIKQNTDYIPRTEGLPNGDWVLVDVGDVIIHLFRPEVRSFYNLERMWSFDSASSSAARAMIFTG